MDYSMIIPKACKFSCSKRAKKPGMQVATPPPPPAPQPPAPSAPPPYREVGHPRGPGPDMGRYIEDFERLSRHPRFGYIEHTGTWRLGFDTDYMDDYYYHDNYGHGPPPSAYISPPGPPSYLEYGTEAHRSSLPSPPQWQGPQPYPYHYSASGPPTPLEFGNGAHHSSPPLPPQCPQPPPHPYPYSASGPQPHRESKTGAHRSSPPYPPHRPRPPPYPYHCSASPPAPAGVHYYPPPHYGFQSDENPNGCTIM